MWVCLRCRRKFEGEVGSGYCDPCSNEVLNELDQEEGQGDEEARELEEWRRFMEETGDRDET